MIYESNNFYAWTRGRLGSLVTHHDSYESYKKWVNPSNPSVHRKVKIDQSEFDQNREVPITEMFQSSNSRVDYRSMFTVIYLQIIFYITRLD
jgi:hypothetical protein